jgi:hypothetical protein
MAMVQPMMNHPPEKPLLKSRRTGECEQELEEPRGLEGVVREVAVKTDGDAESDEKPYERDCRNRPPGKWHERHREESQVDEN